MKQLRNITMIVLAITAMSFTIRNFRDGNYAVNIKKSSVIWHGKKVTGEHFGTINVQDGQLIITDGELTGGSFTIDMSSITSTDLTGEYLQKLNGHLKSADFFGVETYPTSTLKITKVISKGTNGLYEVTGNLTIKNITKSVTFDTQLTDDGNGLTAIADITIDRSTFDIRYGSGSFFDNLGDKTIYDDFNLKIKLVTN